MPRLELVTEVPAPPERVFDLSRSIDLHTKSMGRSGETAVAGVTSGLIGLGQRVTWRARHFGLHFELTSEIVAFERPAHFRDSMVEGPFKYLRHDHYFDSRNGGTTMRDVFDFASPLGLLGRLADALVLKRYMARLLEGRNRIIGSVAASSDWQQYLGG